MSLNEVLDVVGKMTAEEQDTRLEIIQHRQTERRRAELAKDAKDARAEFLAGQCAPKTPAELMQEIRTRGQAPRQETSRSSG